MEKCKICGKETNGNLLCISCQERLLNGEIKKCDKCDSFYIGEVCPCTKITKPEQSPSVNIEDNKTTNENIAVNIQQPKQESSFKKALGTTFGSGCGCSLFIGAMILIGLLLILAMCEGISS